MEIYDSTILIVDDDANVLRLLKTALQSFGWDKIEAATNGAEALKLVEQSPPDLVITDVVMPEIDGHELVRRLRGMAETAKIPILMLGAQENPVREPQGDGADEYLSKPFALTLLKQKVEQMLGPQTTEE